MASVPSSHAKPPPAQDASSIVDSLLRFQRCAAKNISPRYNFVPLNEQTLLGWMKIFIHKKDMLKFQGKPNLVEIGYHYTKRENFFSIQNDGLKCSRGRRRFFGTGIYASNNPLAFRSYGDTGIICLVMRGVQRWCLNSDATDGSFGEKDVDTFSGNKVFDGQNKNIGRFERSSYFDETVLRSDEQIIPLFWYDRELTNNTEMTFNFHGALQAWVDSIFRSGFPPTVVKRPIPCIEDIKYEHKLSLSLCNPNDGSRINPTPFLRRKTTNRFIFGVPVLRARVVQAVRRESAKVAVAFEFCNPADLKARRSVGFLPCQPQPDKECSICFEKLEEDTVKLSNCIHVFHKDCLKQALQHKSQCPVCRNLVGEPIGCCPEGTMTVYMRHDLHCGGFPQIPTYDIRYNISAGFQTEEHENPGVGFRGTSRVAYIPATQEGRNLLCRMCYAFRRGLTFRVGTSLTSGRPNSVCWASIHHKTNLAGGSFGWPDPNYFANVNEELDNLKVPKAQELLSSR